MNHFIKSKCDNYLINVNKIPQYDGGRVVIERLIETLNVKNRLELAEVLGVSQGTLSTWTTRNSTPYEHLIRTHLATEVPMEYLVFGTGKASIKDKKVSLEVVEGSNEFSKIPKLEVKQIDSGKLRTVEKVSTDSRLFSKFGIRPASNDFVLEKNNKTYFINTASTVVSNGTYLFSVNGIYQLGELRLLPDGNIYQFIDNEKYLVNPERTMIHGKVTAAIENY